VTKKRAAQNLKKMLQPAGKKTIKRTKFTGPWGLGGGITVEKEFLFFEEERKSTECTARKEKRSFEVNLRSRGG